MKKYEPLKIIKQEEKKDDSIFEKIKEYFEKTPIEEIRRGWEEAGEKTKNIKSPTITEFMKAQNQAYFNNEKLKFYNSIPDIEKEYNIKVLLAFVRGSYMYGTNTDKSDVDITFIYKQPTNEILKGNYIEQLNIGGNDIVGYEIQRYIQLLSQNNPNILESLDIPDDCLIYKDESMNIFDQKDWISKLTEKTILGYANSQIKKATGLNKNMNNPQPEKRKTILDFCYVISKDKSIPFKEWFVEFEKAYSKRYNNQKILNLNNWGLVKVPNGKGLYAAFIDDGRNNFRGLLGDDNSTQFRLSAIPKEVAQTQEPVLIYYNHDGFETHVKSHTLYWKWVNERNEERFNMNQEAGQGVDLKNMMHLFRLLEMASKIGGGKGLQVRSHKVEVLMDIRKGKYNYKDLLEQAETTTNHIKELFLNVDLIEHPDTEFAKELLLKFRNS